MNTKIYFDFWKMIVIVLIGFMAFILFVCESDHMGWFWASRAIGLVLFGFCYWLGAKWEFWK